MIRNGNEYFQQRNAGRTAAEIRSKWFERQAADKRIFSVYVALYFAILLACLIISCITVDRQSGAKNDSQSSAIPDQALPVVR